MPFILILRDLALCIARIQISDLLNGSPIIVNVLDNNQVSITNVANGNTIQVGAGAVLAILGGAAGGLVRQLA